MKKETVFALILGIVCGIGIAVFLVLTAKQKAISEKKVIAPLVTPTAVPIANDQSLDITDPADQIVSTTKNSITIKGTTPTNSLLVLQSPTTQKIVKTTTKDFSISFPLSYGENIIRITSYMGNNSDDKTLKVYYFSE